RRLALYTRRARGPTRASVRLRRRIRPRIWPGARHVIGAPQILGEVRELLALEHRFPRRHVGPGLAIRDRGVEAGAVERRSAERARLRAEQRRARPAAVA